MFSYIDDLSDPAICFYTVQSSTSTLILYNSPNIALQKVDMSFDINWDKLTADNEINESIKEWLDDQFKSILLPSYIANLTVTDFSLGDQPPEISIRHVGDPFEDFYEEHDEEKTKTPEENVSNEVEVEEEARRLPEEDVEEEARGLPEEDDDETHHNTTIGDDIPIEAPPLERLRTSLLIMGNPLNYLQNYSTPSILGLGPTARAESPINSLRASKLKIKSKLCTPVVEPPASSNSDDIQFIMELAYSGNIRLEVTVNLLVNYPSPNFISLPIKLHITELNIHSVVAVAYLKKSVYFSFLCDINDSASDYFTSGVTPPNGSTPVNVPVNSGGNFVDYTPGTNNRERIDIIKKIRIESEIGEVENNVLRNVGKVERFVVDQLRGIIRDEVAWPSWVCLDVGDEEEEEEEEEEDEDQ